MAASPRLAHARAYLTKAEEYLASAEANLAEARYTPTAGDAVHAGISAKDAIVTVLTGSTSKRKDHAAAVKELRSALGAHIEAAKAERALRELIAAKAEVEYSTTLVTSSKAEPLVRRARALVSIAIPLVRLGA